MSDTETIPEGVIVKTPETHPDHHVVGHYWAAPCWKLDRIQIYFCYKYDSRVDYFMRNVVDPSDTREPSVRAIGKTFREAFDKGAYWHVPDWGSRIDKMDMLDRRKEKDPSENRSENRIVKCACGLPMRSHEWAAHWNGCGAGSSVPVTEQDAVDLLAHEQHMRETHQIEKLFCG